MKNNENDAVHWDEIKADQPGPTAPALPKDVADSIEAGLDDLQHSRDLPGNRVLQKLDRLIAERNDNA